MSILVQDILENNSSIEQTIKITRSFNGAHIRPWVYIQGPLSDGDLRLRVIQGAEILSTQTINYTTINAALDEVYNHGFIRFDFPSLQLNVAEGNSEEEYIIELTMINHTSNPNTFVAWNRDWESSRYDVYGELDEFGDPLNDMIAPFALEIYEYRRR